ncbi:hypothetical protein BH11MYX4_BH11MYX4_49410 [soil metagenome]|jgi:predicted nucleic-acid-binding Zn-ribbon protein
MKKTATCPKCRGRKLFLVAQVQHTYCDAGGSLRAFHVTSAAMKTGKKGMFGGDATEIESAGPYETIVCAGCGYAEWYVPAHALAMLAQMAERSGAVRVIDGDVAPAGPFR